MSAMSNTTTFDSHALVKRLQGAGASLPLAEAIVEAVQPATVMPDISHLATKADVDHLRELLEAAIKPLATQADVANGKLAMLQWSIGGVAILVVTLVVERFFK